MSICADLHVGSIALHKHFRVPTVKPTSAGIFLKLLYKYQNMAADE